MELYRISKGPWTRLMETKKPGKELTIYKNPDSLLFSIEKDTKEKLVSIGMHSIFYTEDTVENFVEAFPKNCNLIVKHSNK